MADSESRFLIAAAAGMLARPALALLARRLTRLMSAAMDRLGPCEHRRLLLEVRELPWAILFSLSDGACRLRLGAAAVLAGEADAVVRGGLADLLEIAAGRSDGDALFFSRSIEVEGDVAFIVALRNALEELQLEPLSVFGVPEFLRPWLRRRCAAVAAGAQEVSRLARVFAGPGMPDRGGAGLPPPHGRRDGA